MVVHALHLARAEDSTRSLLRRPAGMTASRSATTPPIGIE